MYRAILAETSQTDPTESTNFPMKNLRSILIAVVATVALAFAALTAPAGATNDKQTLCHASGQAGTTKYETLSLPPQAFAGHFDNNGTAKAGHERDYLGACNVYATTTVPDNDEEPTTTTTVKATTTTAKATTTTVADKATTTTVANTTTTVVAPVAVPEAPAVAAVQVDTVEFTG